MSTSVGILPMILRWICGVPVAATSPGSYALTMYIGRNIGPVGSGKGAKGPPLTGDRRFLTGYEAGIPESKGCLLAGCPGVLPSGDATRKRRCATTFGKPPPRGSEMQITFEFTCRDCGADTRVAWDTSHSGEPVELKCSSSRCGHVSGELLPAYTFREEHWPRWGNAVEESSGN